MDNFFDNYSFEFPSEDKSPELDSKSPEFYEEPEVYSLETWRSVAIRRGDELFDSTLRVYELEKEVKRLKKMLNLVTLPELKNKSTQRHSK